ncbi:glycoside hydrolase family 31 protein [Amnibacterium sp.]|uniref:glycoside hydrolase family 31 protein n=1 Tax=Amnibacterium sp. TaxID=1872496 RepID=UPI003F7B5BA9
MELRGASQHRWHYGDDGGNLGGTGRTLDAVDGRMPLEPGVLAGGGVAVVDDSRSFLFETDGWIGVRSEESRDLYVFAYGHDFEHALRAFYLVSGQPSLLPRWALGNWWSRYHRYTDAAYIELMDRFTAEGLPFSVAVIDMDWHEVESVPARFGSGWTGYSWNPALIPNPVEFLGALHRRGLHVTLNLHPADGVRAFEVPYPEMARAMGVDPDTQAPIAFDPVDRTFLQAYFEVLHRPIEEQGVDFWWIDWQQGRSSRIPGVDPLWVLNHFHHLDSARAGGAGMTFSRYAGPGSHRYAVGFSGDAVISWASLAFQPEFTATAANVGYGWWSHDIGGHIDGVRDDDLATRWVQFGTFSPIMRLHSASNTFIRKEPWMFPPEPRAAMHDALRFRHRLVPYLHTMNHRAAAGTPLVRPMYHLEQDRAEAYAVPNQYAFGSELIVAPVVAPRDPTTLLGAADAWLPPGLWTDIFTGVSYTGDRSVRLHRPLQSIPVLLRAGGILPLDASTELIAGENPATIEVLVAPGAPGSFTLIEDGDQPGDGICETELSWHQDASRFNIGPARGDTRLVPARREWRITFLASADGELGDPESAPDRFTVVLQVESHRGAELSLPRRPERSGAHRTALRQVIQGAQTPNASKPALWSALNTGSVEEQLDVLGSMDLPAALRDALIELVESRLE